MLVDLGVEFRVSFLSFEMVVFEFVFSRCVMLYIYINKEMPGIIRF
jgi:hypothetical protein